MRKFFLLFLFILSLIFVTSAFAGTYDNVSSEAYCYVDLGLPDILPPTFDPGQLHIANNGKWTLTCHGESAFPYNFGQGANVVNLGSKALPGSFCAAMDAEMNVIDQADEWHGVSNPERFTLVCKGNLAD